MARSRPDAKGTGGADEKSARGAEKAGASPGGRRRRGKAAVRARLIEAAARVVGEHGYAGASIARITQEAGVAHGAFYLHFSSRQELFDILLPMIGDAMIEHIGGAVREARTLDEIETQGLLANFGYLAEHPDLVRILREAEYFAPEAYRDFIGRLGERYVGSLDRSRAAGEVRGFREEELPVLADILMGARNFLIERHTAREDGCVPLPPEVARVYLKFVLAGLKFADRVAPVLASEDRPAGSGAPGETADEPASGRTREGRKAAGGRRR